MSMSSAESGDMLGVEWARVAANEDVDDEGVAVCAMGCCCRLMRRLVSTDVGIPVLADLWCVGFCTAGAGNVSDLCCIALLGLVPLAAAAFEEDAAGL